MAGVKKIILSNYTLVAIIAALGIISAPIYIKNMGVIDWGYVGIVLATSSSLSFLDIGMSQIIPREMRSKESTRSLSRKYSGYLAIYTAIGVVSIVGFMIYMQTILRTTDTNEKSNYILLGFILYTIQSISNSHYTIFGSLGRQINANKTQLMFTIVRTTTLIIFTMTINMSSYVFACLYIAFLTVECAVNLKIARDLGLNLSAKYRFYILFAKRFVERYWKFIIGVTLGVIISLLDRWYVMITQDESNVGIYVLVLSFGLNLINLQYPLYKNMITVIAGSDSFERKLYTKKIFFLNFFICVIPCIAISVFSKEILQVWIGNDEVIDSGEMVLSLISIAVAINSIHHLNHLKMTYFDNQNRLLWINLVSLLLCALFVTLTEARSLSVAAGIWVVSNVVQAFYGFLWSLKNYKKIISFEW